MFLVEILKFFTPIVHIDFSCNSFMTLLVSVFKRNGEREFDCSISSYKVECACHALTTCQQQPAFSWALSINSIEVFHAHINISSIFILALWIGIIWSSENHESCEMWPFWNVSNKILPSVFKGHASRHRRNLWTY